MMFTDYMHPLEYNEREGTSELTQLPPIWVPPPAPFQPNPPLIPLSPAGKKDDNKGLVIGLSVGGALLFLLVIILIIMGMKKKPSMGLGSGF